MKFIIDNAAIKLLGLDDNLSNLPVVAHELSAQQQQVLTDHKVAFHAEEKLKPTLLGIDYERVRSEYKKMNLQGINGAGVKVAVIDTGCNVSVSPADYTYNIPDNNTDVSGNPGHGTRVASTIKSNIGLANGCELHFIKCFDNVGVMTESWFLAAIDYCIENNIDVVNMSFDAYFSAMSAAIITLRASGCIPVASSGNDTSVTTIATPAGMTGCVAVNAVKENGDIAYKNILTGGIAVKGVDIACAGYNSEGIGSTGSYSGGFGTSFSAPFFCGAFALYKHKLDIADNNRVLQHMLNKAMKQNSVAEFGAGILTF